MTKFTDLFATKRPIIACIHLPALPGAPGYDGHIDAIYDKALQEAAVYSKHGADALIIENFGDKPFYPAQVPAETIAMMAAVSREIMLNTSIPVGINVLRNDAHAALAIATAVKAHFIRINVHMNAVIADQGYIQGNSHHTLRLRQALHSNVLIFADVGVKHAAPLAGRGLAMETKDLCERGMVDAVIVSGAHTGGSTSVEDVNLVKLHATVPVIIGSGITPENVHLYSAADGFIVGSYLKQQGYVTNPIDLTRLEKMLVSVR